MVEEKKDEPSFFHILGDWMASNWNSYGVHAVTVGFVFVEQDHVVGQRIGLPSFWGDYSNRNEDRHKVVKPIESLLCCATVRCSA